MTDRFSKTIAALTARESNDWDLADALLAEVKPSRRGIRTGAYAGTFEDLAKELESRGIEVSVSTLRQYRDTAAKWKPEERQTGVSFSAHRAAIPAGDEKVQVIERLRKAHGRVRVTDVRSAVAAPVPASAQREKDNDQALKALQEALPKAKTKGFARWLAAKDLAELEDVIKGLNQAYAVCTAARDEQVQKAKAAPKAADPKAAPKGDPKAKAADPKAASKAAAARKGRVRGV